jgi:putative ABC transport system permease protein
MYNSIEPAVLVLVSDSIRNTKWTFSFQVSPGQKKIARDIIKTELEYYFPEDPFELHELSEAFRTENVFKILGAVNNSLIFFTVVNLFLAVIGLLGLVSFTLQRRTKEIGVRKITGSSSWSIFILLTKEYMVLLVIASIIAWPFGYLEFVDLPGANKMPLPYWLFLFSTVVVFIVILLTSFYHTMKTISTSPVEALKYE